VNGFKASICGTAAQRKPLNSYLLNTVKEQRCLNINVPLVGGLSNLPQFFKKKSYARIVIVMAL